MEYKIVDSFDSLHLGDNSLTLVPLSQEQWPSLTSPCLRVERLLLVRDSLR